MYYIFLDFEMNQPHTTKSSVKLRNDECPFEILEIGAVRINDDFETIDKFHSLVRNSIYPEISPAVIRLTKIDQKSVKRAKQFKEVIWDFTAWLSKYDEDYVIFVWGSEDIKVIQQNFNYHKTSKKYRQWADNIIDLQENLSKIYKYKLKKDYIGLKSMLEYYKIPMDIQQHKALNDAKYLTEIFKVAYKRLGLKNSLRMFEG